MGDMEQIIKNELQAQGFVVKRSQSTHELIEMCPELRALGFVYQAQSTRDLLNVFDDESRKGEDELKRKLAELEQVRDQRDRYWEKIEQDIPRKGKSKSYQDLLEELEEEHPLIDFDVLRTIAAIEQHPATIEKRRTELQLQEAAYWRAAHAATQCDELKSVLEPLVDDSLDVSVSVVYTPRLDSFLVQFREKRKKPPKRVSAPANELRETAEPNRMPRWLKPAGIIAGIGLCVYGLAQLDWRTGVNSRPTGYTAESDADGGVSDLDDLTRQEINMLMTALQYYEKVFSHELEPAADELRDKALESARVVFDECDQADEVYERLIAPHRERIRALDAQGMPYSVKSEAVMQAGLLRQQIGKTRTAAIEGVMKMFPDCVHGRLEYEPRWASPLERKYQITYDAEKGRLEMKQDNSTWAMGGLDVKTTELDGICDAIMFLNEGGKARRVYCDINARMEEVREIVQSHRLHVTMDEAVSELFKAVFVEYNKKQHIYRPGGVSFGIIEHGREKPLYVALFEGDTMRVFSSPEWLDRE